MRQTILLIAAMALIGCGKKTTPAEAETKAEPKATEKKPIPAKPTPVEPTPAEKTAAIKKEFDEAQSKAFTNSLGMTFVPVPTTEVLFCIWETRVKDYAAYSAANKGVDGNWKNPENIEGVVFKQLDTHPVVNVSWNDAQRFCAWLTTKELAEGKIKAGEKYRLPTDAEWSVAVGLSKEKGTTPKGKSEKIKNVYPWGRRYPPVKEAGNYRKSLKVDSYEYTSPVGRFEANSQGIHDLGGNVCEWCEDWYDPARKSFRVLRGASFHYGSPNINLSSYRSIRPPNDRIYFYGFRCVLARE
jgi:formylglycine-generating enzyme required for sulfatase activity